MISVEIKCLLIEMNFVSQLEKQLRANSKKNDLKLKLKLFN